MSAFSRPPVSVVVPFAGTAEQAQAVVEMLRALNTQPADELIIADNSGTVPPSATGPVQPSAAARSGAETTDIQSFLPPTAQTSPAAADVPAVRGVGIEIMVVRASGEHSASHSRNVAAAAAQNDWMLFLDADVVAPAGLIDAFFSEPIGERVGAVTGDIYGIPDTSTLAARYGTARNFLGQRSHVNNPLRPRASSANLLVRREAFQQVGGYTEGIWAAEDTDFTWRLHAAGWSLEFNEHAVVAHAYRRSLRELGRQWRGYAAGARWLSQRYPDFKPDPGINRGIRLILKRLGIGPGVASRADGRSQPGSANLSRGDRLQFLFVQIYLAVQEQIGLRMSNRVGDRDRFGRGGSVGSGGPGQPAGSSSQRGDAS